MKQIRFALLFLFLCVISNNFAQTFSTTDTLTEQFTMLEDVVVTSQPKETYQLRQQPISSATFYTKDLVTFGVNDLRDLSLFVPGLTMPNYGSRLTSAMYIRGIGSRINSPAVTVCVDGVPLINKSAYNQHSYDLAHVDVLRGPQGTLYGQNTEGGMVRFHSRNPMQYQGSDVQITGATGAYRLVQAATYQRPIDRLAFSLAAFYQGQNGFFKNQTTNERADKQNEAGARARLVADPTRNIRIDWISDYQFTKQNGYPYGLLAEDGSVSDVATNRQGNYKRHTFRSSLGINVTGRYFDFNSTTSWQYLSDRMLMDIDYLPQDYMHMEQQQLSNAVTQEFVFKSKEGKRWRWTTGAFFSKEWLKTHATVFFHDDFNALMGSRIRTGLINQMIPAFMTARGMTYEQAQAFLEQMIVMNSVQMSDVPGVFRTPSRNIAFFHESNIEITPRLIATLGVRFDCSRTRINYESSSAMAIDMNVMRQAVSATISSLLSGNAHADYNQLLPKFGLLYKFNDSNIYGVVSKGYRAGGYNIQMFSDILQTELANNAAAARSGRDVTISHDAETYEKLNQSIAYKPEECWNYEAGAHLSLLNGKLHADVSAFYMALRNQQLSVMAENYGFGRVMVNAGKSASCGVEVALRGVALRNRLSWSAAYSFTRAVFKQYDDTVTVSGEKKAVSYADNYVPFVPQHHLALAADYTMPLTQRLALTVGANLTAEGAIYWDEANAYKQPFYALLGAHAMLQFHRMSINLWARNLTNTTYQTFAVTSAAAGSTLAFAQRGNPHQFGIDLRFHF